MSIGIYSPICDGESAGVDIPKSKQLQDLVANAAPKGLGISLTLHTRDEPSQNVFIPFGVVAVAQNEIKVASIKMVNWLSMHGDRGRQSLMQLFPAALHPTHTDAVIDRATGDRFYVLQFSAHAPLVIRLSPTDVVNVRAKTDSVIRALMN